MRGNTASLVLFVLLGFSAACSPSSLPSSPAATSPGETSIPDLTHGLTDLPAYRARLTLSFEGTQLGQATSWSQTYTLTAVTDPQTRLLAYSETGRDEGSPAFPALQGIGADLLYLQETSAGACLVSFATPDYDSSTLVEPAGMLPMPDSVNSPGASEMIAGVETRPYTFSAGAVTGDAADQGSGTVWRADDRGIVLKYSFELSGGSDVFDPDTSGTFRWEYQLELLDPSTAAILPEDCPLPLPQLPVMTDAANVQKFPGFLIYETSGSLQEVVDFYAGSLPTTGFAQEREPVVSMVHAFLVYSKDGQLIEISVEAGPPVQVFVSSRRKLAESVDQTATPPGPSGTVTSSTPQMRVISSLGLLNGSDSTPSVFPSWHMEYSYQSPAWVGGVISQSAGQLSADVEGQDVHFIFTDNSTGDRTEVYKVGGQDYEVLNGQLTPGAGLAALVWYTWPLDPTVVLSTAALETMPAGMDSIDGRTVEIYQLSGSTLDDPSGMLAQVGFTITRTSGQVWVDQATGGLVRAVMDYEQEVKDGDGVVQGTGSGHFEILISQIDEVLVELPR